MRFSGWFNSVMFAVCAYGLVSAASAQQTTAVQATPAAAPIVAIQKAEISGTISFLPANTQIDVTLNSELNSKSRKVGEPFAMSVSHDVMLSDYVVIPKGTPANGKIAFRTGKGAFGKSAKMEIEVVDLVLNGRSIPLSGRFRQEGSGNTGATVGTAVAVGPFAAFVTGRSAVFEQGREFRAFTRDALPVALAPRTQAVAVGPTAGTAVMVPAVVKVQ